MFLIICIEVLLHKLDRFQLSEKKPCGWDDRRIERTQQVHKKPLLGRSDVIHENDKLCRNAECGLKKSQKIRDGWYKVYWHKSKKDTQ